MKINIKRYRNIIDNHNIIVPEFASILRSQLSDSTLLHRFKVIRYQCKYKDRQLDTLLEYINELEFRQLKYRL